MTETMIGESYSQWFLVIESKSNPWNERGTGGQTHIAANIDSPQMRCGVHLYERRLVSEGNAAEVIVTCRGCQRWIGKRINDPRDRSEIINPTGHKE